MSDGDERDPNLASENQLKFIGVLKDKVGVSDEDLASLLEDLTGKESLDELDKRDASALIDELHVLAKEKGIDLTPRATDKQIGFLKSLRRRAHLTEDEFTALLEERAGVSDVEEIGRREASALIDELLKQADAEKGGGSKGGGKPAGASRPGRKPARQQDGEEGPPPPPPPPPGGYDDDPPF